MHTQSTFFKYPNMDAPIADPEELFDLYAIWSVNIGLYKIFCWCGTLLKDNFSCGTQI